jgi:hypothetical protein
MAFGEASHKKRPPFPAASPQLGIANFLWNESGMGFIDNNKHIPAPGPPLQFFQSLTIPKSAVRVVGLGQNKHPCPLNNSGHFRSVKSKLTLFIGSNTQMADLGTPKTQYPGMHGTPWIANNHWGLAIQKRVTNCLESARSAMGGNQTITRSNTKTQFLVAEYGFA